ncbi:hypothetical protein IWQ60_004826 [Tieghemiomyces parasiticus]|uniref:t-SNARE affecting a late Golgi compartment protein 1 n=1 Tax=Tieghemiomyces parasiticus TaxID=78921 RepID=A0A9W8DZ08_9FUNG|nr:hypothetical protein IWQ60_004826 [Tieghemiomyces parasiticus]
MHPRPESAASLLPRDALRSSNWMEDEQQHQTTIIRHQDEQLDSVMGTVQNIRRMAGTMGNELEDHNVLLEELDSQTDQTQGKLSRAMKGVETMIKKNSDFKN